MTDAERKQIVQEVLTQIKASSQGVNELEEVSTLDGVKTLPAMKGDKVVAAPVSLLGKPATDAAAKATEAANKAVEATTRADAAATLAANKAGVAETAAGTANEAAGKVNTALGNLENVAGELRGTIVNVNRVLNTTTKYADITAAANAVVAANITEAKQDGVVFIFFTAKGWACKQFSGNPATEFNNASKWKDFGGGSGSGSGFYNVTVEQPLSSGYYTKETAVAALAGADIADEAKLGMIITFEVSAGKWADYRFAGTSVNSFLTPGAWEEYGGAGAVKQVTFNGEKRPLMKPGT